MKNTKKKLPSFTQPAGGLLKPGSYSETNTTFEAMRLDENPGLKLMQKQEAEKVGQTVADSVVSENETKKKKAVTATKKPSVTPKKTAVKASKTVSKTSESKKGSEGSSETPMTAKEILATSTLAKRKNNLIITGISNDLFVRFMVCLKNGSYRKKQDAFRHMLETFVQEQEIKIGPDLFRVLEEVESRALIEKALEQNKKRNSVSDDQFG